jgi:hypothetical protein
MPEQQLKPCINCGKQPDEQHWATGCMYRKYEGDTPVPKTTYHSRIMCETEDCQKQIGRIVRTLNEVENNAEAIDEWNRLNTKPEEHAESAN